MDIHSMKRTLLRAALCGAGLAIVACRPTFDPPVTDVTGEDGGPGTDYTVQCSGWFPDWIARSAPPAGASTFQLAQGYPLGIPQVNDDGIHIPPEHLPDVAERRLMAAVRRGEIARDEIEIKSVRAPLVEPIRLEQGLPVWTRAGMQPDIEALEYYPGR